LAWAILEQAVDDLATFARYGLITPEGQCLPWPFVMRRRIKMQQEGRLAVFQLPRQRANICLLHKGRTNTANSVRGF
jgi:hypothetical protein